ncbi:MAG: hypothetical protein ACYC5M_12760 [Anaerolineae bacterium]
MPVLRVPTQVRRANGRIDQATGGEIGPRRGVFPQQPLGPVDEGVARRLPARIGRRDGTYRQGLRASHRRTWT